MSKLLGIVIGPELCWGLAYLIAGRLAAANGAPPHALDKVVESFYWIVPLLALATFALWFFPVVVKDWLLLRVWILGLVGGHYVLDRALGAYSEQGPGIGTAYIIGMMLVLGALIVGSVVVKVRF